MKKKKTNKISLAVLKYNILKLRSTYQVPYQLTYEVTKLDKDSDIGFVKLLSQLSEHYLRVKGYYKKYPAFEKNANEEIKKIVADYR